MLNELFPRRSSRFLALPLLGPIVDDFDTWLSTQGYRRSTRRLQARALGRIDRDLRRHGVRPGATWKQADLDACWRRCHIQDPNTGGTIHALRRFLQARSQLVITPAAVTRAGTLAKVYGVALEELRGLAPLTIRQHVTTATDFLIHLGYELRPERLGEFTASDVEAFVRGAGKRLQRASLQHTVAQVRGFLRFLASRGLIRPGFDQQIDTPRVYRQEQLPRSLPWPTVQRLLHAMDRRTALGLRDYAMLFLIATYGLRACEIVVSCLLLKKGVVR